MGFGLSREDVIRMAYIIAERTGKKHTFKDESAGRDLYEGLKKVGMLISHFLPPKRV